MLKRTYLACSVALVLVACGGSNSSENPDATQLDDVVSNGSEPPEPEPEPADLYSVGGEVSQLAGTDFVMSLNGSEQLSITENGSFTFDVSLENGGSYDIEVLRQPKSPNQTCVVENGTGVVSGMPITDIVITCELFANLLVGTNNKIIRFDETTGELIDEFVGESSGGLNNPLGIAMSRDRKLLVSSRYTGEVLRYDGTTGEFLDVFVARGTAGLTLPHGLTIGSDNNLYVVSNTTNQILRFDGLTGQYIDTFASGGLSFPTDLVFGPEGYLYVSSSFTNRVIRFDGTTGQFIDVFASGGGLSNAQGLAFGPDGNLYVGSYNNSSVIRYDGQTGSFIDVFASGGGLNSTVAVVFGPDGNLYVSGTLSANVIRYDGTTGSYIDEFLPTEIFGGISGHHYIIFTSQ